MKVARTVLRGEGRSNPPDLPDLANRHVRTCLLARSGKSGGLLLPSPLRTVRATFIAYRSSTLNAYGQRNSCNTVFTIHTCNDFTTSVARSQSMSCHIIELLRWIASDALRPVIVLLIGIQLDISSAFLSFC